MSEQVRINGEQFHQRIWKPSSAPKALVVIVHGIGEHLNRYEHLAAYLNKSGYAVASYDQRGHGKSGGLKGYIEDWSVPVGDLATWYALIDKQYPGIPHFLFAHSLGALIAYHYIVSSQPKLAGVVFSAPALKVSKDISPFLQKIAPILGKFFPKFKATRLNPNHVSRDPEIVEKYVSDPLVNTDGVYARTGAEALKATGQVVSSYDKFSLPFLVLHGSADKLTDPKGSELFHRYAASSDKEIKIYDGLYHELVNEPEKEQVMSDIVEWLDRHL